MHCESWDSFDWTGQPTSPYCVVAGDVARDPDALIQTLEHLGHCYHNVFFIDGNDEHRYSLMDIGSSYKSINQAIKSIKNQPKR